MDAAAVGLLLVARMVMREKSTDRTFFIGISEHESDVFEFASQAESASPFIVNMAQMYC
jgi:hypothetical protein